MQGEAATLTTLAVIRATLASVSTQLAYFSISGYDVHNGTCVLLAAGSEQSHKEPSGTGVALLYCVGYLLTTGGGWLSDARLGHARGLTVGASILLFLTVVAAAAQPLGMMCSRSVYWVLLLPLPFGLAFVQPNLLYAVLRHRASRVRLLSLYFAAASVGDCLGLAPVLLRTLTSNTWQWAALPFGCVLCGCACSLGRPAAGSRRRLFVPPSRHRLGRYFVVFSMLTPALAALDMCHPGATYKELLLRLNSTGYEEKLRDATLLQFSFELGCLLACCCLAVAAADYGCRRRFAVGLALLTATKSCQAVLSLFALPTETVLVAVALGASSLIGAAYIVMATAAYQIFDSVVQPGARIVGLSIMYGVWSIGGFLSLLCRQLLRRVHDELLRCTAGHLVSVSLLLLAAAYARWVALPAAKRAAVFHDHEQREEEEEDDDEGGADGDEERRRILTGQARFNVGQIQ